MTFPAYCCLFCDDIRQEVGDKASYMGVYGDNISVPHFPFKFATFSIAVRSLFPLHSSEYNGILLIEIAGEKQEFPIEPSSSSVELSSENNRATINIHVSVAGLQIKSPTEIQVYFKRGRSKKMIGKIGVVALKTKI
ncbi:MULTISPECIES: DUF6941 family protein [Acidiphilium]|uniref:DUF6941 family protein n=1 Tax=Acidiphilium TaxID=522 RepID=UPI00257D89B2|nr:MULTISPECIES: hypothetical protein [Acidiphilium]HQT83868.1 hypothetical protein [Acidiphilium rubrum]